MNYSGELCQVGALERTWRMLYQRRRQEGENTHLLLLHLKLIFPPDTMLSTGPFVNDLVFLAHSLLFCFDWVLPYYM